MVPGEWQFNVKLMPKPDGDSIAAGPQVLHENMTVAEAKQALHTALAQTHNVPTPERMRLRMAQGTGIIGAWI